MNARQYSMIHVYSHQASETTVKKTKPSMQRRRLGNQLYDILRERIAGYRFLASKKIDLELLTQELEVSRPPLWEAVCRLEQEGLVEIKPNRGVYVVEFSWQDAAELYMVRGSLEALASRLAVKRMTPVDFAGMAMCLEEHRELVSDGDWQRFSPMDHQFHQIFYASGGRHLRDALESIKIKLGTIHLDIQPLLGDLYDQHVRIHQALENRDEPAAVEAVLVHNRYMENYCLGMIDRGEQ